MVLVHSSPHSLHGNCYFGTFFETNVVARASLAESHDFTPYTSCHSPVAHTQQLEFIRTFFSEIYLFYFTEQSAPHLLYNISLFNCLYSSGEVRTSFGGILFKRKFVVYEYVKEQGTPLNGEIDTRDSDTFSWNSCFGAFSNRVLFYMRRKYSQINFTRRTTCHSSVAHVRQLEYVRLLGSVFKRTFVVQTVVKVQRVSTWRANLPPLVAYTQQLEFVCCFGIFSRRVIFFRQPQHMMTSSGGRPAEQVES